MNGCPCDPPMTGVSTFSPEWYRAHRDHHLAVFPDVDDVTRANLDMLVDEAERLGSFDPDVGCTRCGTVGLPVIGHADVCPANFTRPLITALGGIHQ